MMPYLDRAGALRLIREYEEKRAKPGWKNARIVMTSALHDKKTLDEAFNRGCDSFLAKPIDVEQLKAEIEKAK